MEKNLTLNENDVRLVKAYLDNQEKLKAFLTAYFYILSPGTGDGIMESENYMQPIAMEFLNHKKEGGIMSLSLVEKLVNA